MRVTVRASGVEPIVLGSGESLVFGRAPADIGGSDHDPVALLTVTSLALPRAATNVSRLLGEITIGEEAAAVRWLGRPPAQLSSLFDAPGGARRVTVNDGMTAMLDPGENQVLVLLGRMTDVGHADLLLAVEVDVLSETLPSPHQPVPSPAWTRHRVTTAALPELRPHTDAWFVALALAQPWLSGDDDYPRPPTNREISERIQAWRGDAGRLNAPQRVHEAIQHIAGLAFGAGGPPFRSAEGRRMENVRYAIGRRVAEVGLVTAEQLAEVERAARR